MFSIMKPHRLWPILSATLLSSGLSSLVAAQGAPSKYGPPMAVPLPPIFAIQKFSVWQKASSAVDKINYCVGIGVRNISAEKQDLDERKLFLTVLDKDGKAIQTLSELVVPAMTNVPVGKLVAPATAWCFTNVSATNPPANLGVTAGIVVRGGKNSISELSKNTSQFAQQSMLGSGYFSVAGSDVHAPAHLHRVATIGTGSSGGTPPTPIELPIYTITFDVAVLPTVNLSSVYAQWRNPSRVVQGGGINTNKSDSKK
jgi:hypothetical protein